MIAKGVKIFAFVLLAGGVLAGSLGAADVPWPANRTAVTVDNANRNAERIRRYQNAKNSRINTVNRY